MGAAKGTLESDDNDADTEFCKQFNKWASDVDAGVTGNTLECRVCNIVPSQVDKNAR